MPVHVRNARHRCAAMFAGLFAAILLPIGGCAAAPTIAAVYARVSPSVVTVVTLERQLVLDDARRPIGEAPRPGLGSGVIIDSDGHIMTAAHLVQTADSVGVRLYDGSEVDATVIASDPFQDLALLRLDEVPGTLRPATLADSDAVRVGDRVFVVGSPYGIEHSLTVGYISARHKFEGPDLGIDNAELFQTDAAINSGNSGSPLFNLRGEVVGIASVILSQSGGFEGLGFAITSNTAADVLLAHRPFWSGMTGVMIAGEIAELFNVPQDAGYLVQRIAAGSPAERMQLRPSSTPVQLGDVELLAGGDILLSIDGIEFSPTSMRRIQAHTAALSAGQSVTVRILRGGRILELSAAL